MSDIFDITTLTFLVAAVVIFMALRNVLGKRTGNERPPFNPFDPKNQNPAGQDQQRKPEAIRRPGEDNVVPLPQRAPSRPTQPANDQPAKDAEVPPALTPEVVTALSPAAQANAAVVASILAADKGFDPAHFLSGAKAAYEMIVTAFARGDRNALKPLLSKEVFEGFDSAIKQRESDGQVMETSFVGIGKADIIEASLKARTAHLTVKFRSMLIQSTKDRDGAVVAGDPTKVSEVTDVWTFARDLDARDPNWRLVATEAA
jgi:predicted lipid-binding transport protein (Tim44 family)